ncbi:MAG: hypothetical protein PSU94_17500 [Lacunisphaera sp.]|nr:hypothetical protein [Lacunisphaera sp.]
MTIPRFSLQSGFVTFLAGLLAVTANLAVAQMASADQQVRVQITELGCMRTLLFIDANMSDLENRLAQQFTDVDYRVFPSAVMTGSRTTSDEMRAAGEKANADLVVFATVTDRQKASKGDFVIYEGTATVQIYSRVSGELLVTKEVITDGKRTTDVVNAKRTARANAVIEAAHQAIEGSLAKAHKVLVHEAVVVNVFSDGGLLAIMEYIGKMEGVYHVRRLSFDRKTNEALLEIIGSPRSETYWRAYLEKMPKTKVNVQVTPNGALHNKYPAWFQPPSQ